MSHARAFDRRLIRLALNERKALAGAVALGLIIAAARVGQGIALALGIATVFNGGRWSNVVPYLAIGVVLVAVRAVAIAWQGSAMAGASVRITTDLRIRLVASILKLGPGWLVHERTGELEAVMVDGVEKLDAYFRLFLAKVIVAALTAVTIVVVVIAIDPVAGVAIAAFALAVVLLPSWEYRALGSRMAFWSDNYRPLSAEFVDNLQGMSTLKTFGVARRRGGSWPIAPPTCATPPSSSSARPASSGDSCSSPPGRAWPRGSRSVPSAWPAATSPPNSSS